MPFVGHHTPEPCFKQFEILYEDDDLLLVNKPDGLLSVPGRIMKDCLITRIQENHPTAKIVHRLDLDTSGIMAIPLNKETHSHISRQFQERNVQKSYDAILFGCIEEDGEIDLPIACDWERRPKQKICYEGGKAALTHYEVVEQFNDRTRVLFKPTTGRSHQLRIHSAEIHHPIIGCDLYAHDEALNMSDRLMLHATTLSFTHPITGEPVHGVCPAPF